MKGSSQSSGFNGGERVAAAETKRATITPKAPIQSTHKIFTPPRVHLALAVRRRVRAWLLERAARQCKLLTIIALCVVFSSAGINWVTKFSLMSVSSGNFPKAFWSVRLFL